MSRKFITAADRFVMCVAWVLVSILRLVLLPIHLLAYAIWKGCDEVVALTTEMQTATISRIKAE